MIYLRSVCLRAIHMHLGNCHIAVDQHWWTQMVLGALPVWADNISFRFWYGENVWVEESNMWCTNGNNYCCQHLSFIKIGINSCFKKLTLPSWHNNDQSQQSHSSSFFLGLRHMLHQLIPSWSTKTLKILRFLRSSHFNV